MKNKYTSPSVEITLLAGSDVLMSSAENDTIIDTSELFL